MHGHFRQMSFHPARSLYNGVSQPQKRKEVSRMDDKQVVLTVARDLFVAAMQTKALSNFSAKDHADVIANMGKLYEALAQSVAKTAKALKEPKTPT